MYAIVLCCLKVNLLHYQGTNKVHLLKYMAQEAPTSPSPPKHSNYKLWKKKIVKRN